MPWVGSYPLSFTSAFKTIPVDEDLKWEEMDRVSEHINGLLKIIENSGIEICKLNFKIPLHKINCVLRCTTVPERKTIYVIDILLLD